MASPLRPRKQKGDSGKHNGMPYVDPQQPILDVAPLNCVPYTGPPIQSSNNIPADTKPVTSNDPALVFLPSTPTGEEWSKIVAATKTGVGLTGSAALGKVGPTVGLLDIGESQDAYLFRVSLPGVTESQFSCDIQPSGKIMIKGLSSTGVRRVHKNSQVFEMLTQNLCPPGHFSVSFELPGPVNQQEFTGSFGVDGVLEGIVKKRQPGV